MSVQRYGNELRRLPVGTPLLVVEDSHRLDPGEIVMLLGEGGADDTVMVFKLGAQEPETRATGGGGWRCTRFAPYVLDRNLKVVGLTPSVSVSMQEHAFANGWKWNGGETSPLYTERDGLLFTPITRRFRVAVDTDEGLALRVVADANQLECAKFLLSSQRPAPMKLTLPQIVGDDVAALIRNSPTAPTLRGLIRAATSRAVPVDVMGAGTDSITKWLEENCDRPFGGPAPIAPTPPPPPPPGNAAPTRMVRFDIRMIESGSCGYTCYNHYRGQCPVPEDVIALGEDAVNAYVREYAHDRGSQDSTDYEYSDHDCSSEEDSEENIESEEVVEQFNNERATA